VSEDGLFSAVAHEVKTPLAVLRGYAELLVHGRTEDVQREAPAAILEAAERLAPAVDDLLLVLEIQCGGLELVREPVDLAELLPGVSVFGDARLLGHALEILERRPGVSARAEDGYATITATAASRSRLELYVVRLVAELHGGELRETPAGLALTLPLS
jgi:signal transduction histidine kinase